MMASYIGWAFPRATGADHRHVINFGVLALILLTGAGASLLSQPNPAKEVPIPRFSY